jgi:GNAT superfamily N-acetyltransferase
MATMQGRATDAELVLRLAGPADQDAIDKLMKESTGALFPAFYDERQTASSIVHVAHVDPLLVEDGTYFVIEAAGEIIACGGWSKRDKLYTGSADQEGRARLLDPAIEPARVRAMFVRGDWTRRGLGTRILEACEAAAREAGFRTLALVATLPGLQLYRHYGFREVGGRTVKLPDGVTLDCVAMDKDVSG